VQCIVGAGPPGAYNITGDGVLTGADLARELNLMPLPVPGGPIRAAARAASAIPAPPFVPPAAEWLEALSHPAIMDASKAKAELGWEPRYDSLEALRDTLRSAL
jgi:nucleoside-diphosphate-sugar epimerase